jgi:tetratricopeptide (TPR) repeat protein
VQVAALNDSEAFDSAELLCSFIYHAQQSVASTAASTVSTQDNDTILTWRLKAIDCVNFAISFMGKHEYSRALKWFEQALDSERNFQAISGKAEVEYAEKVENNEEISEMYHYAMTNFDADEVKLHMMECFFKTQKYLQSIECFEATLGYGKEQEREQQGGDEMMTGTQTAKKNRTGERDNDATMNATIVPLKYHLFKAKAHHALGHTQKAMREYEFVFKKDASYLECVPHLISLSPVGGQRAREIFKAHYEKNSLGDVVQNILVGGSAHYRKTIHCWIDAMEGLERNSVRQASPHVNKLTKERPKQPEILIMRARWDGLRGKPDKALEAYEMVSNMDDKRVANMEKYAAALRDSREGEKLRILAQRLFEINENSCESWVASAMASDLSKEKEKALSYAQKAKDLNPRNQVALVTLGECAMKMKKTDLAIACFRSANEVKPSLKSYHGLVKACSAAGRRKEAIESAQAATELNTHSAFAASLLGDAHKRVSGDIALKRTKDAFAKALQMDPSLLRAAFGLADACMRDNNDVERAKFVIKNILEKHPPKDAQSKVMLHVKYATILVELNERTEAVQHFQSALGIEPNNARAKSGLEACEKALRAAQANARGGGGAGNGDGNAVDDAEMEEEDGEDED